MKLSRKLKIATIVLGSLSATFGAFNNASAASDPTSGRFQQRQSQEVAQYHKCAGFALRVYQAALSQAGNNSAKVRAARSHYQGNLARCRATFL